MNSAWNTAYLNLDMECFSFSSSLLKDLSKDEFSSSLCSWSGEPLSLNSAGTHFGFVYSGEVELESEFGKFLLSAGMFFSIPAAATLSPSSNGQGIVMSRVGYFGFFQLGGPVEQKGRLRYIDGCTDSLLLSPVVVGDPCLNLLHIPAGTQQTQHTHPSLRLGMIISGEGICVTPEGDHPLNPGTIFYIPAEGRHSFHTDNQALRVIAYHPDSDFGPTHEDHPMVNKTIISTPS